MLVIYGAQLFAGQMLTFSSPSSVFLWSPFSREHTRGNNTRCAFLSWKNLLCSNSLDVLRRCGLHNAVAGTRCNLHHGWDAQTLANHTLVWLLVASRSSSSWFLCVCVCVRASRSRRECPSEQINGLDNPHPPPPRRCYRLAKRLLMSRHFHPGLSASGWGRRFKLQPYVVHELASPTYRHDRSAPSAHRVLVSDSSLGNRHLCNSQFSPSGDASGRLERRGGVS